MNGFPKYKDRLVEFAKSQSGAIAAIALLLFTNFLCLFAIASLASDVSALSESIDSLSRDVNNLPSEEFLEESVEESAGEIIGEVNSVETTLKREVRYSY